MAEINQWLPPDSGSSTETFEDYNRGISQTPKPPSYVRIDVIGDYIGVTITMGDTAFVPGNQYYKVYFLPQSFISESAIRDPFLLQKAIQTSGSIGIVPHPDTSDVTFQDYSHIEEPGYYICTGVNARGQESEPGVPVNNPVKPDSDWTQPPLDSSSVSVTKTSEIPPGTIYYDTIYTLTAVPSPSKWCIGFQVYIENYANLGLHWEALFIGCEGGRTDTVSGTLRLPSDAAGHTITFYFVPISAGGARNVYSTCTSTTIASGP